VHWFDDAKAKLKKLLAEAMLDNATLKGCRLEVERFSFRILGFTGFGG
jgi:hypothetical protein